jgi:hypothetical protein
MRTRKLRLTPFLGREMHCPLGVRWDLTPVYSGQPGQADREFWARAYDNLKQANRKVARNYNRGLDRIVLVLGTLLGIA